MKTSRHRLNDESSAAFDCFHEFLQNNLPHAAVHEIVQQTHHAVDKILDASSTFLLFLFQFYNVE